ncbi:MAG: HAMP domain-containing protein [Lachnospiraceae bacterium]|nr:HAMP domain-containing protein [Lachnospiraceae bacterium]
MKKGKQKNTKKKIANEIMFNVGRSVLAVLIILGIFSIFMMKTSIMTAKQTELTLQSKAASNEIADFFDPYMRMAEQMSVNPQIQELLETSHEGDSLIEMENYETVFANMLNIANTDKENIMAAWIADIDANMVTQSDKFTSGEGWEFYDRAWAYCTKTGEVILTEPYVDASTGSMIISTVSPVYSPESGDVLGVAGLDISLAHVQEIMQEHKIGNHGYVVLFSTEGNIIYAPDENIIQKNVGEIGLSENVVNAVNSQQETFLKYTIGKTTKYGFTSVMENSGCMVLSNMPFMEYYFALIQMIVAIVALFIVGIIVVIISIKKVAARITKPILELNETAMKLAEGDLDVELVVNVENEIGELGHSIEATVARLKEYIVYIDELSAVLKQIADGKLAVELKNDYVGEFSKLKEALLLISSSMTEVLSGINESAGQVAGGADELASAAQMLAEGSGTQAAAVQELVATTATIAEQVQESKDGAEKSAKETQQVTLMMEHSREQMQAMMQAMEKIQQTSHQVVGIIQAIEEIADQTNLLSLNASIEAARVGEAGKGFAVVAGEIGKLAEESSKAANNTRSLINISMEEIENGNAMAEEVMNSLKDAVDAVERVNGMIQVTADNASDQAYNMDQIRIGIEEISESVQDTSATAEECSATSEELASQAAILKEMVGRFEY